MNITEPGNKVKDSTPKSLGGGQRVYPPNPNNVCCVLEDAR
jgi:hypothetical protein